MKNKILVTGGCGFMGSHFIQHMLQQYPYVEIINIDNNTHSKHISHLLTKYERYTFVEGDITDRDVLQNTINTYQVELIINFAAQTKTNEMMNNPLDTIHTNIMSVANILEISRISHIPVIQISGVEVFGSEYRDKASETSPLLPNNPYAAAKASGDLLCRAYARTYGVPVMIAHSCNIMGPDAPLDTFIPHIIMQLIQDKKVSLYGDGLHSREWMYVEDSARAIDYLIEHGTYDGSIYNIGTGFEMTNLELVQYMIKKLSLQDISIEHLPDIAGYDRKYALDSSKIRLLGWNPVFDIDTSIRKTLEWYQNNQS